MEQEMKYYEHLNKKVDSTLPFFFFLGKSRTQLKCSPKWHEEIEIKYILSGTAEFICGTEVLIAGAGDIVVVNPCELHGMQTYGDDSVSYHLLMVSAEIPLLQEGLQGAIPYYKHLIRGDAVLTGYLDLLFREITEKHTAYQLGAMGALAQAFSHLQRYHAVEEPTITPENRRMTDRIKPALDHIVRHYTEEISIQGLAERCAMSVYHFCRVFKAVTGDTAISYINQLRINKASALLSTSTLPVAEIAAVAGFSDVCYFSRCFKKQKGISPAVFQRNAQKQQNSPI